MTISSECALRPPTEADEGRAPSSQGIAVVLAWERLGYDHRVSRTADPLASGVVDA
ncbi:protein of unknown function [Methylorubrum extorquens]|uniref:Uncharacterized protein n=1 Tax=Methylorubrum extorquens TaxID=408 RepID=A0A2N9ATR4_METEX|nr:protein of unknown function [Methylorubrum extorquens]